MRLLAVSALFLVTSCSWVSRNTNDFMAWSDRTMPTYESSNQQPDSAMRGTPPPQIAGEGAPAIPPYSPQMEQPQPVLQPQPPAIGAEPTPQYQAMPQQPPAYYQPQPMPMQPQAAPQGYQVPPGYQLMLVPQQQYYQPQPVAQPQPAAPANLGQPMPHTFSNVEPLHPQAVGRLPGEEEDDFPAEYKDVRAPKDVDVNYIKRDDIQGQQYQMQPYAPPLVGAPQQPIQGR